jgi:hypothetical protein
MLGQHWTEQRMREANMTSNINMRTSSLHTENFLDLLILKKLTHKSKCAIRVYELSLLKYPYSQALNPATTSNPDGYFLPVYDDAATVYADLLTRLNVAIPKLTDRGFGDQNQFTLEIPAWKKFVIH